MSPYWASVRLRGIGVAVITRMSAALALLAEVHALADAEAVLLVDDGEAEVAEGDVLLEEGVGADEDGDLAGGQRAEPGGALGALVAAGEDLEADAGGFARAARARAGAGGRGSRSGPSSPPGRRPRRRRAWRGARPASCRRRRRPAAGGSSGWSEAMSAVISATERVWARGRRVGERGEDAGLQACRRRGSRSPWRASSSPGRWPASSGGRGARRRRGARGPGRRGRGRRGRSGAWAAASAARQAGQRRWRSRLGSIHSGEVGDAGERVLRRRGSWCGASGPG